MCQYTELFALSFISAGETYSAKGNCTKLRVSPSFVAKTMQHTGISNRQVLCYCSTYFVKALCCRSLPFPEPSCGVVLFCSQTGYTKSHWCNGLLGIGLLTLSWTFAPCVPWHPSLDPAVHNPVCPQLWNRFQFPTVLSISICSHVVRSYLIIYLYARLSNKGNFPFLPLCQICWIKRFPLLMKI